MRISPSAVVLILASFSPFAYSQCQEQTCNYNGTCYQCLASVGGACSVPQHEKCSKSCTDTACSSVSPNASLAASSCILNQRKLSQFRNARLKPASLDDAESSPTSTGFQLWPGNTQDPLGLISVTHDAVHDLFSSGIVRSHSEEAIAEYKIGWIGFLRNRAIRRGVGRSIVVNAASSAGENMDTPAQNISPELLSDSKLLVFFVDEVTFLNGTKWSAPVAAIENKYR